MATRYRGPVRPWRCLLAWVCTICVYSCAMNERHRLIAVILDRREVTSQQQLVELLAEQGVAVTQATVSRDLDRLGAVRVRRNGHMVYALPEGDEPIDPQELLRQVLGAVLSIEASSNLCILKTKPAQAMPVARALRPGRPDRGLRHDRRRRHDPPDRARAGGRHRHRGAVPLAPAAGGPCLRPGRSGRAAWPAASIPRVLAYSQSLSVDGRLLPYDVRASKAHVRMLGAAGDHPRRRRRRDRRGARPRRARRGRDRRGRPLADRAAAGRAARRDRQARPRRALAQRPGGDRVPPLLPRRRPRSGRHGGRSAGRAGRAGAGRRRPRDARATRTCSARSRCRSATTSPRTRGRCSATSGGCSRPARRPTCSPLGAGALAGSSLPLDPDAVAHDLGLRRAVRELRRRRRRPRLRGRPLRTPARSAPCTSRGSRRSSCCGRRRSSGSRSSTTASPRGRA